MSCVMISSYIYKKRPACRSTNKDVCKLTFVGQHSWSNPNSPKRSGNSLISRVINSRYLPLVLDKINHDHCYHAAPEGRVKLN